MNTKVLNMFFFLTAMLTILLTGALTITFGIESAHSQELELEQLLAYKHE